MLSVKGINQYYGESHALRDLDLEVPAGQCTVLMGRNGVGKTTLAVNLAVARRTFKPSILGKLATAIYVLTGVIALYANYAGQRMVVVDWFVYASLFITLASSMHYVYAIFRGFSQEPEPIP